jgi:WD40 repeat protein
MNDEELRRILKGAYGDRQLDPEASAHMFDRLRGAGVRGHRRLISVLAGAVVFAAIAAPLGLVIWLGHHEGGPSQHPAAQVSAAPSAAPSPAKPSSPASTPTPTAQVVSTITAPAPLIVTYDPSEQLTLSSPVRYIARNYQGQVVGTLTINPATAEANGVLFSPDGSKFLIGGGVVFDVYGHQLADLYSAVDASALTQPMWGDDSEHICGIASDGTGTGSLLEFSVSGPARTVAQLGPLTGSQSGWYLLACSPEADRAVVWQSDGSQAELLVIRLSSGQVVATYPASEDGAGAASHDGSVVAIDGPSGITILDTVTGRQLATVVRWGDVGITPFIGEALSFSWDGSRLLVQSAVAQGGPRWIVAWATDRDLVTNATPGVDLVDVSPITSGAIMFIQNPLSPYAAFLLENNGTLQALPAAAGDGAAPS